MKSLNFNCKEVLPSLLDKTKTQSIRKAWNVLPDVSGFKGTDAEFTKKYGDSFTWDDGDLIVEKPAKFKVGERVKLYWKRTSKYDEFCKVCGMPYEHRNHKEDVTTIFDKKIKTNYWACVDNNNLNEEENWFKKCLGEVEITKVNKVKLTISQGVYFAEFLDGVPTKNSWIRALAKKDGFKSQDDMFKYFDDKYDLSTPKIFHVYRWRWV